MLHIYRITLNPGNTAHGVQYALSYAFIGDPNYMYLSEPLSS